MLRRRPSLRGLPADWKVRVLVAVGTACLGWKAVTHSLANVLQAKQTERAYLLAPSDGRISARLSKQLSGADVAPEVRKRSDQIARQALRRDATAVDAVATLGVNALLRNEALRARQLFAYSERLSRRDLRTQLWAIEDAVTRNDIPDALRHYDIALRTHRAASDLLYPILASAIAEPEVRSVLVRRFAGAPFWAGSFLDYVSAKGPDPEATALLFRAARRANVPLSDEAHAALLNALLAAGKNAAAWSYYGSIRRGADRQVSRDPDFRAIFKVPTAFDWIPVEDGGIWTSMQSEGGGVFDFVVSTSVGGALLRQVQMLPQGDYVLEWRSGGINQPAGSRPYWDLVCYDGRRLGRVEVPNSESNGRSFRGRFTVPGDCPVQTLVFAAQPSAAVGETSGRLYSALLRPIR